MSVIVKAKAVHASEARHGIYSLLPVAGRGAALPRRTGLQASRMGAVSHSRIPDHLVAGQSRGIQPQ